MSTITSPSRSVKDVESTKLPDKWVAIGIAFTATDTVSVSNSIINQWQCQIPSK